MEFTIRQLKEIAKGLSIKGYSRMVKADLYAALEATGYWEPEMEPKNEEPQMESTEGLGQDEEVEITVETPRLILWEPQKFSVNTEVLEDHVGHNRNMKHHTKETQSMDTTFDYNEEFVQDNPYADLHLGIARYLGGAGGRTLTMAAYGYYWAAIALYVFIRNGLPVWVPAVKGILTEVAISFSYGLDAIKLALVWFVMQQFGTSECLSGLQAKLRMVYIDTHEAMYV